MRTRTRAAGAASARELMTIPGIGPAMAQDLLDLGIRSVSSLKGRNPEALYRALCRLRGGPIDRCVLYVFRCAVYFASHARHDPDRLLWWNWSDKALNERGRSRAGAERHG